jgi:hypothetical protein
MRTSLAIGAVILFAVMSPAQEPPATNKAPKATVHSSAMKPFVGTWKLVSSQETLANGTVQPYGFGPHPAGIIMYDAKGNMCAQVVNTDRPKWKDPDKPTPEEVKTAFDGFGGYCGTYTVDEKNSTMAHHPEVSLDPNQVGQPKPRSYRFEGNHLIYSGTDQSPDGEVKWVMTWEKVN